MSARLPTARSAPSSPTPPRWFWTATPLHTGANISIPAVESLALNGTGGGNGALRNLSGNNTWAGTVTLQTNSSIGADLTTQLTVSNTVKDPSPAPIPPANLTKVGMGTVVFPAAAVNTYTGSTTISSGILNIQNASSLGFNTSAQQRVTVAGTSGTFTLFFTGFSNAVNTGPLSFGVTAAQLQNALNSVSMLQNPLAPGYVNATTFGTATVIPEATGNSFIVTFGGTLAGVSVPLLFANPAFFTGNTSAATLQVLAGGASSITVATGATLQLQSVQGSPGTYFTESSLKPLTINSTGVNNGGRSRTSAATTPGARRRSRWAARRPSAPTASPRCSSRPPLDKAAAPRPSTRSASAPCNTPAPPATRTRA